MKDIWFTVIVVALSSTTMFCALRLIHAREAKQDPLPTKATAILLPDYTWHMNIGDGVVFGYQNFCFIEDLGGREVLTCAPIASLLGWRNLISSKP